MDESQRKSVKKLIFIQILAFASFSPMNYYNVYLRQVGFNSTQLGFWGAIVGLVGMSTLPIWGIISDKTRSVRLMFMFALGIYALLFGVFPLAGNSYMAAALPFLYVLIFFYGMVKEPTHSLQDAWMISTISPIRGLNYASIRMWGSLGFGVVSIIFSFISPYIGIDKIFYAAPLFILPAIILLLSFKETGSRPGGLKRPVERINPFLLFKNYYYATALIMTLVLSMYIGMTQSFYAYILDRAGVDAGAVGLISGYGSLLQVGLMWFVGRHCRNIPTPRLLIIGGAFGILENITYGLSTGLGMMMLAATFWSFAISARVSLLPSYLYSLVPREYAASSQTLNSTIVMLLTIAGNLIGGVLVSKMGISSYNFLVAGIQLVLTALFALSIPFGEKVLKIKAPESVTGRA